MTIKIGEILGSLLRVEPAITAPNAPLTEKVLPLPECRMGVELEFEGASASEQDVAVMSAAGWTGKIDGSLREGGWEWVLFRPLSGARLINAVFAALDLAKKRKYKVSIRTGLHTHCNVQDMSLEEYKQLLAIYAFLEPALYHYAGDLRWENVHCLPWYGSSEGMLSVSGVFNSSETTLRSALDHVERYGGLNIAATRRFGSVEWRHLKATTDPKRIIEWIIINQRLKEAAIRTCGKMDIRKEAATRPKWLIEQLLQQDIELLWYKGIEEECGKIGSRSVLDLFYRAAPRFTLKKESIDWDSMTFLPGKSKAYEKFEARKPQDPPENVPYDEAFAFEARRLAPRVAPRLREGGVHPGLRPNIDLLNLWVNQPPPPAAPDIPDFVENEDENDF